MWLLIGLPLGVLLLKLAAKYHYRFYKLCRRAKQQHWISLKNKQDPLDRDLLLCRDGVKARICFKTQSVQLYEPICSTAFTDFKRFELWLSTNVLSPELSENPHETLYYRFVDKSIAAEDYFDELLRLIDDDPKFCNAIHKLYYAGYISSTHHQIIADYSIASVKEYLHQKNLGFANLDKIQRDLALSAI